MVKTLAVLPENPGLIPPPTWQLTVVCNSSLGSQCPFLTSMGTGSHMHRHTCRESTMPIKKIKTNKQKTKNQIKKNGERGRKKEAKCANWV